MGIFDKIFGKNIDKAFSEEFKNTINSNKTLYKYYKKHLKSIKKLLGAPTCTKIMIENIETLIVNQEFEKFIDILNNDSILLYLSENKLDIKQLQFIFTHQNELNQEQLNNFNKLSQLSDKGFNNYNNFTNEKIKKLVPVFLFEESYYNLWVNNDDFIKYINGLLMFNNFDIVISKIEQLNNPTEFSNFLAFITKYHKKITENTNMKMFEAKYFNVILDYMEYIYFEDPSEISAIIDCIENSKMQLLSDYFFARSKGMPITSLERVDNIFQLFYSDDLKKEFLRVQITGSIYINDEEKHFLENKINDERFQKIFELLSRIEYLHGDKEFEILYGLINGNTNLVNEYHSLIPVINKTNANKIVHDINSIEPNNIIESNGIKIFRFDGNEFRMLIHAVYPHGEPTHFDTIEKRFTPFSGSISMSLISNKKIRFYKDSPLIYFGYLNIEPSQIVRSSNKDAATLNGSQTPEGLVEGPDKLVTQSMNVYNEVVVNTISGNQQKPDFILCFDKIDNISMKYALEKGLPIYLINLEKYKERNQPVSKDENVAHKIDLSIVDKSSENLALEEISMKSDSNSAPKHIHK